MRPIRLIPGALLAPALLLTTAAYAQVSFERVLNAADEPHNWLSYSGTLDNQRYSRLEQIDTGNVDELELAWVWQARSLEKFEATALVDTAREVKLIQEGGIIPMILRQALDASRKESSAA